MAKKQKKKKRKAEAFILDCSVTLAWFFEDETDAYAEAVEDSLTSAQAVVPAHWHLEVANALLVSERRKRTSKPKVGQFLKLLVALPIMVDDQTPAKAWDETVNLARDHNLSSYDAAYLELALRRKLALTTLDEKLRSAMRAVGIPLYLTE